MAAHWNVKSVRNKAATKKVAVKRKTATKPVRKASAKALTKTSATETSAPKGDARPTPSSKAWGQAGKALDGVHPRP